MPRGWVEITFERLELDVQALGLAQLDANHRLYAIAEVGPHDAGAAGRFRMGRSRRIHQGVGSVDQQGHFSFADERMIWRHGVRTADAEAVDVVLTLWLDRGDLAPQQQLQWVASVAAPWDTGERTAVHDGHTLRYRVDSVVERNDDPVVLHLALDDQADPFDNVQVVDEPVQVILELTAIDGLFRPVAGLNPQQPLGTLLHGAPLSTAVAGYTSADHEGRIFINRLPNDTWTVDTQYIDLTVELWVEGLEANQRDALVVTWTIFVPDDPSDDDPHVHREAGPLLDPDDHAHGEHLGARPYDNEGANPHYAQNAHPWEQLGNHALQTGAAQPPIGLPALAQVPASNDVYRVPATTTTEAVDDDGVRFRRRSRVRLHCPDVRGDRLVVRATVAGQGYRVLPAQTGVMTMWERIDLEYRKMQTAFHLPVAALPAGFEPVFVQMDVHPQADIVDIDRLPNNQFDQFLDQNTTFLHRNDPGWFCLIAAKRLGAAPAVNPQDRFVGPRRLRRADAADETMLDVQGQLDYSAQTDHKRCEYIDLPGDVPDKATIRVTWGQHPATTVKFDLNRRQRVQLGAPQRINLVRQRLRLLGYDASPHDSQAAQATGQDQQAVAALRNDYQHFDAAYGAAVGNAKGRVLIEWLAWLCEYAEQHAALAPGGSNPGAQDLQQAAQRNPTYFTRLWFVPHDVQDEFTAGNGSTDHAYDRVRLFGPRRTETIVGGNSQGNAAGGYGAPADVDVRVTELAGELKGQSPGATVANAAYFSGRTLIATRHPAYDDHGNPAAGYEDEVRIAIIHELVHAFGMPHKCGGWDVALPRATTCCMNYPPNWMVDANHALVPNTANHVGTGLCARHIKEVRRVHLEDNLALADRGWA